MLEQPMLLNNQTNHPHKRQHRRPPPISPPNADATDTTHPKGHCNTNNHQSPHTTTCSQQSTHPSETLLPPINLLRPKTTKPPLTTSAPNQLRRYEPAPTHHQHDQQYQHKPDLSSANKPSRQSTKPQPTSPLSPPTHATHNTLPMTPPDILK